MDLRQYLLQRKSWIAACAGLALLAGVATALVLALTLQPTYRVRLDLQVPAERATSSGNAGLFIADLQQAVLSGDVRRAVREEIGRDTEYPVIAVARLGSSTTVRLETQGEEPDVLSRALTAAVEEGVATVDLAPGNRQAAVVEVLRTRSEEARARLDEVRNAAGSLFPDSDFRALDAEIRGLEIERQQALDRGATLTARVVEGQLAPVVARRDQLRPFVLEFQEADDEADAARDALLDQQSELAVDEALAASAPTGPEPDLLVEEQPVVPTALSTGALAALATFALGITLVAVVDLARGRRSSATDGPEHDATDGDDPEQDVRGQDVRGQRGAPAAPVDGGRRPSSVAPEQAPVTSAGS